jgi:hypothetical protein
MRSRSYRKCKTCDTTISDGRKVYCYPCDDKRRDERELKRRHHAVHHKVVATITDELEKKTGSPAAGA